MSYSTLNCNMHIPNSFFITDVQAPTSARHSFSFLCSHTDTAMLDSGVRVPLILIQFPGCNRCSPTKAQMLRVGMTLAFSAKKS